MKLFSRFKRLFDPPTELDPNHAYVITRRDEFRRPVIPHIY